MRVVNKEFQEIEKRREDLKDRILEVCEGHRSCDVTNALNRAAGAVEMYSVFKNKKNYIVEFGGGKLYF